MGTKFSDDQLICHLEEFTWHYETFEGCVYLNTFQINVVARDKIYLGWSLSGPPAGSKTEAAAWCWTAGSFLLGHKE